MYDETDFLDGPNFGGIATSRSLIAEGAPPDDPPPEDLPPDLPRHGDPGDGSAGGGAGGGVGGGGLGLFFRDSGGCDCQCPDIARPRTAACRAQCVPEWARCASEGDGAEASQADEPPTPTVAAQKKWFSRLVSGQGLDPEVEAMLVEDFATMSADTRAYLIRKYRRGLP